MIINNRTAIIAEIGVNHGGDEKLAWKMIKSAHINGADFIKLQSFITENFFHPSVPYYLNTKKMELSIESQKRLFKKAKEKKIKLISTPYDFISVDMIEEFDHVAYKIASMDNDNIPLIEYIAKKNRYVIVSCGMTNLADIKKIVNIMKEQSNNKLILLHCISDYPTEQKNLNLSMIKFLKDTFGYPVGVSDHSIGLFSSYISASLGAVIIEKHFTTDKSLVKKIPNADHDISIVPSELRKLRKFCESVPIIIGKPSFINNQDIQRKKWKRGLYAKRDIEIGEKLNLDNTILLRPVEGIKAGEWNNVYNKEIKRKISKLQPIFFSDLRL